MDLITVREFEGARDADGFRISKDRLCWYSEQLEDGNMLFFPKSPFQLADEEIELLLSQRQAGVGYHKNIAYRPSQDRLSGFVKQGREQEEKLRSVMRSYSCRVIEILSTLLPHYAADWRIDFASFRPLEERGRDLRSRARNDRLHIDSFPTRPTGGDRILRVFTNINPREPRIWITSEGFEILAHRYAQAAGLAPSRGGLDLPVAWARRCWARISRFVGLPRVQRSPYDRCMLRLHHFLKDNLEFQASCSKHRWEFPPNSTWILFTDTISHAVLSGQYALEQTVIVSRSSLIRPDKAPVKILEDLLGFPLTP
ncbi:MAG TPA: Kdo hydroxylase family protein [Candidatus Binatia bacterium]|jgi:hypothetical protein|nr:Kdo hydroxylase family protein [Candidatus Binatia bacterium]